LELSLASPHRSGRLSRFHSAALRFMFVSISPAFDRFWRASMATIRGPARAVCVIGSALLLLTACDKLSNDGTDWARAALERNENLTILSFDKTSKTFTVKARDTGEIQIVRADQIIGAVPGEQAPNLEPAAAPATAHSTQPSSDADTRAAVGEEARPAPKPTASAAEPDGVAANDDSTSSTGVITNAAGKVFSTSRADSASADANDRRTIASGPGYSIKAGDSPPPSAIRLASSSSDIPSPARGVALERRYEPMICQGQRLLHIDGRNLEFEGDAISAEDGCEIHITNSHIIAHGIGISARAANVHIKNSVVEGDSGSVSASEGAQVYTQSSTFKGLSRRLDTASFHDLGGTVWN
jgi:hypothetical protein